MAYTRDQLERAWPEYIEKVEELYRWEYVKTHGPRGKGTPWTEIVAEKLLEQGVADLFARIAPVTSRHYNILEHLPPCPSQEQPMPHSEKEVVKWMLGRGKLGELGIACNYEAPLVDRGKQNIDLIALRDDGLVLVEVKKEGSTESLLRAVLEIKTYSCLVNEAQLRKEFKAQTGRIALAVLIHPDSDPGKELAELLDPDHTSRRKNLRKVLCDLGVEIYTFQTTDAQRTQLAIQRAWPC